MNSEQLESIIKISIVKVKRLRSGPTTDSQTVKCATSTGLRGQSPLSQDYINNNKNNNSNSDNSVYQVKVEEKEEEKRKKLFISRILDNNDNNHSYTISNLSGITNSNNIKTSNNNNNNNSNSNSRLRTNVSLLRHLLITRIARKARTELTNRTYLERFVVKRPYGDNYYLDAHVTPHVSHYSFDAGDELITRMVSRGQYSNNNNPDRLKRLPNYTQDIIHHCLPEKMACHYQLYGIHHDTTSTGSDDLAQQIHPRTTIDNIDHGDYYDHLQHNDVREHQEYLRMIAVEVDQNPSSSSLCLIKGVS